MSSKLQFGLISILFDIEEGIVRELRSITDFKISQTKKSTLIDSFKDSNLAAIFGTREISFSIEITTGYKSPLSDNSQEIENLKSLINGVLNQRQFNWYLRIKEKEGFRNAFSNQWISFRKCFAESLSIKKSEERIIKISLKFWAETLQISESQT